MAKLWTQPEIQYLIKNDDQDDSQIARALNRTVSAVRNKRHCIRVLRGEAIFTEPVPEPLSKSEKLTRIYRLAAEMHIRLQK